MQHSMEGRTLLVRVLAVNSMNREVHCKDKHGGKLIAAYRQTPVIQQIPATGEVWSIVMRDWHWLMDARIEEETEQQRTAGLEEGDLHLKVKTKMYLNDGLMGYGTWEQFVMNGTSDRTVTLSAAPVSPKGIRAYNANGILIDPSLIAPVSGTTLDLGVIPPAGKVTIYYSRI